MEEWEKSTKTEKFGEFIEKWVKKVSDFHILFGEEVY
jgi:hypothetical protein